MKPVKVFSLVLIALLSISPLWADDTIPTNEEKSDPPIKRSPSNSAFVFMSCENGLVEITFMHSIGIVRCEVLNPTTNESLTSVIDTQVGTEFIKLPDENNTYIIVLRTVSGEYITSYLAN